MGPWRGIWGRCLSGKERKKKERREEREGETEDGGRERRAGRERKSYKKALYIETLCLKPESFINRTHPSFLSHQITIQMQ